MTIKQNSNTPVGHLGRYLYDLNFWSPQTQVISGSGENEILLAVPVWAVFPTPHFVSSTRRETVLLSSDDSSRSQSWKQCDSDTLVVCDHRRAQGDVIKREPITVTTNHLKPSWSKPERLQAMCWHMSHMWEFFFKQNDGACIAIIDYC